MRFRKEHMAFVLAGFLVFPLVFQSWHVVHHHEPDRTTHECLHGHDHAHHYPINAELQFAQDKGVCYVCNYEFPVNTLPDAVPLLKGPHPYQERIRELCSFRYQENPCGESNPRAPPLADA
jgi:hypothetical protein